MKKIVIDPGHGGKDPGALGPSGVMEKDVVLEISKKAAELLEKCGLTVALTRTSDGFVELTDRAKIANSMRADYFVSIHANSAESPCAEGTETYAYAAGGEGELLAGSVQNELARLGRKSRGVKFGNFSVLRNTKMPAVLTEVAFVSNTAEEQLLASPDFQSAAASAVADGIINYLGIEKPAVAEETPKNTKASSADSDNQTKQTDYSDSFAKSDIEYGMELGIFSKTDTFRPKDFATREELAAVMARTLKSLGK